MLVLNRFRVALLATTLFLGLSTIGCGDDDSPSDHMDASPDTAIDAANDADADIDAHTDEWDFDAFAQKYNLLTTVAGAGAIDNGNDWDVRFEGADAITAELSRPHHAMADMAGNIYIADKEAHAIRLVDVDGKIHTFAGNGIAGNDGTMSMNAKSARLSSPNGLYVLPDGRVFIYDFGNDRVCVVDANDNMREVFKVGGSGAGRGLWVSNDESLAYISAGTVLKKWTIDGGVEILATGFTSLGNLDVDKDGNILLTDRGASKVYRIEPDGNKTHIAGNGMKNGGSNGSAAIDRGLDEVRGVAVHSNGGYFLATHKGDQIHFVDPVGNIHLFLDGGGNEHSGDGEHFQTPGEKISEPRAISIAPNGDLLITEHDNGFIRRIEHR